MFREELREASGQIRQTTGGQVRSRKKLSTPLQSAINGLLANRSFIQDRSIIMAELIPPENLRCEYATCPQGIGTPEPRFSWNLTCSKRGQTQTAYQIIVAGGGDTIDADVGDCWDSGKVASEDLTNIPYDGSPLVSNRRYFYKVRWWDNAGSSSSYSERSFFDTALLEPDDWHAEWVTMMDAETFPSRINTLVNGMKEDSPQYLGIYLRHEFSIKSVPRRAKAFVSGLGFYDLRMNGRKVGDRLMDPAQTDYRHTALYSAYDVTGSVKEGENAVGLILGNGRHIDAYGYGKPKGILQLHVEYEDGSEEEVLSGDSWHASHGPLMENGIYYGERYDARKEMPGWDLPGFDAEGWSLAEAVPGPPLASQTMAPIRSTDVLKPKSVWSPKPGVFIYDFGQNFTGWARLRVSGPEGAIITLRFAEVLDDNRMLSLDTLGEAKATDTYILRGIPRETYEPRFTYHGFRYVEMTGFPGVPSPANLEGIFVHSDVERSGTFHCSNPLINAIHKNVIWGQLSNLMSVPTDCPQRGERMGWMGDAQLAAEESLFNFDMVRFYEKYLNDIRFAQAEDGSLSDVVPPYWPLYPADPAWGTAYITIAWLCYLYCGDTRVLEDHFEPMSRYVDFLRSNSEGHILKALGRYSDWCPPGSIVPKSTPVELTSTWYYYHDALLLSRIATVLGRQADARRLSALADAIKRAFNDEFLDGSCYATVQNGPLTRKNAGQTSQALPLFLDMVPEEKHDAAVGRLLDAVVRKSDYHVDTGIVGTRYLFDVLTREGHAEVAYRVATQRTYPSWGYMIEEGATTLWERWESLTGGGMNSHNHIMLGSIDAWFYRTIAGLSPLEAGWKKICIKPHIVGDLSHATATLQTLQGRIHASWEKSGAMLKMVVSIPVGSCAEIYVPVSGSGTVVREGGTDIWSNGTVAEPTTGISAIAQQDDTICITAGSGRYAFSASG